MEKPLRTLIVEDEFDTRWLIHRLLEPYAVCDVAINGEEALLAVTLSCQNGTPYGLIFVDTTLPDKTIDRVLKEIRRLEEKREIPCQEWSRLVVLVGLGTDASTVDAVRAECECTMSKPINKSDFLGQLHSLGFLQA